MVEIFNSQLSTKIPSEIYSSSQYHRRCSRQATLLFAIAALIFLISTIVLAILFANASRHPNELGASEIDWPPPSGSSLARFKRAAVSTDNGLCSEIARDILIRNGNAIDATIASLFCTGVVNPQSSGLGGGFLMTIYNSTTRRCITIDARETAPAAANQAMYVSNPNDSSTGYRSIAIPSELHGFWTVFQRYGSGNVPWSSLIEPSIKLAKDGFPITSHLAMWLKKKVKEVMAEKSLSEVFVNPSTGNVYEEGDIIRRPSLASTLQSIANSSDPIQLFYQGEIAQIIASEIAQHGGIITLDDLRNYRTIIHEIPIINDNFIDDLSICGPPPPSSFAVTQAIVAIMAEFYGTNSKVDLSDPLVYHRLIEAEKFAFVKRLEFGDAAFVPNALQIARNMTAKSYAKWVKSMIKDVAQPTSYYTADETYQVEDHGTSHVSTIDPNGNAVACTDTVNQILGSMRISPTLGILWNDEMDDFSTPGHVNAYKFKPSKANFIEPGKRPLSSMSPTIVYNRQNGKVKLVVGASGGSMIITSVAQTMIRSAVFNQTIKEAVDGIRFHNQFSPNTTFYESFAPEELIKQLHIKYHQNMKLPTTQHSVVQALHVAPDGFIYGNSDFRRETGTHPCGF